MAVLFDMFGVIGLDQTDQDRTRIEKLVGVGAQEFWPVYWYLRPSYDRGEYSSIDYWQAIANRLGTRFTARRVSELIDADLYSWSAVDHDVVNLIKDILLENCTVGLLSNIYPDLAAYYEQHYPDIMRLFSVVGLSCRIGYAKPDHGAYDWCCRKLNLAPEKILFIDDRQTNIDAAREFGMRGHHFVSLEALSEEVWREIRN